MVEILSGVFGVLSVLGRTVAGVVWIEVAPERCEACGARFGPYKVLVGWDNLHEPPCRSFECRGCGHRMYVPHPRHVER